MEKVAGPKDLFQALYHHFLCLADTGLQLTPAANPHPVRGSSTSSPSVAAGVQGDVEGERVLCIRAMSAVYSKHAATIGVCNLLQLHMLMIHLCHVICHSCRVDSELTLCS